MLEPAGESREAPPRYVPEPGEEELQWSVHRNTRPATAHDASEMYQKAVDWKRRSAARWGSAARWAHSSQEITKAVAGSGPRLPGRGLLRICMLPAGITLLSDMRLLLLGLKPGFGGWD